MFLDVCVNYYVLKIYMSTIFAITVEMAVENLWKTLKNLIFCCFKNRTLSVVIFTFLALITDYEIGYA